MKNLNIKNHTKELKRSFFKNQKEDFERCGFNYDNISSSSKEASANTYIQMINDVLTKGLDIGGLWEIIIPVTLVHHKEHGYCFYSKKKDMLYPVQRFL